MNTAADTPLCSSLMTMPVCVRPSKDAEIASYGARPFGRRKNSAQQTTGRTKLSCLDVSLPGVTVLDLQRELADAGVHIPSFSSPSWRYSE